MPTATIGVRLPEEEKAFIQDYASVMGISVSEFARRSMLERIEDEIDYRIAAEAYEEYLKDPETLSLDEVVEGLGL